MTVPKETTEEDLAVALHDILTLNLLNPVDSDVRFACEILGHPEVVVGKKNQCRCGERRDE
jgi:hypothetical protein